MKRFLVPLAFAITAFCAVVIVGAIWFYAQTTVQEATLELSPDIEVDEEDAYVPPAYVLVHVEPQSPNDMREHWPDIVDLIELADSYGAKITLHFSSTWASYLVDERLELVHTWDEHGHEIGLHHHGLSHAGWDGYTNVDSESDDRQYEGNMDELLAMIEPLSADGVITSASMSDEETDWPDGILYNASQTGPSTGQHDLVTSPTTVEYDGQEVILVGKSGYAVDKPIYIASLEDIEEELNLAQEGEVMGLVIADPSIEGHWDEIVELFVFFDERGVEVRTVTDILEEATDERPEPPSRPEPHSRTPAPVHAQSATTVHQASTGCPNLQNQQ